MVGYCMGVAAACAALYVVGYYMTVAALMISRTRLGMLSQFSCCIQDAAAAAIAALTKFPQAKSIGLVDLFLLVALEQSFLKCCIVAGYSVSLNAAP